MKKITTLLMALGVVFMGSFMFSDMAEARYGRPDCPYNNGATMGQQSNLTEEQQKKLSSLMDEHHAAMASIHQKLVQKEAELRLVTVSEPVDTQKVTAISKEMGELRGQLLSGRIAFDEKLAKEGFDNVRGYGYGGRDCFMRGNKSFGQGMGHGMGRGHGHGDGPRMGRGYHGHGMGYHR